MTNHQCMQQQTASVYHKNYKQILITNSRYNGTAIILLNRTITGKFQLYSKECSTTCGVAQHTQTRSFRRQTSQPITWLILTNKTVQESTHTKYNSKKLTTQNTAKQSYSGSVASYDTRPGNEMGLFYNAPETTQCTQGIVQCMLPHIWHWLEAGWSCPAVSLSVPSAVAETCLGHPQNDVNCVTNVPQQMHCWSHLKSAS